LTGATGLVGGHLAEVLAKEGKHLFSIQRQKDRDSYFVKQGIDKKFKSIQADILDYSRLEEILNENKIEYIFHLAAKLRSDSLHQTVGFNIMGTNNILEAARNCKSLKGIIIASTNRAYVESGLSPKEMRHLSNSPYDLSKTAADLVAQAYVQRHRLPLVICRFGNVYGPGDRFNRIVSLIIKNILNKQTLKIKISGGKRSYIYAGDIAIGLLLAANHSHILEGQSINFDSKEEFSVIELITRISNITKKQCKYKIMGSMKEDIKMKKLKLNSKQKILKWEQQTKFEEGIRQTFNWHIKFK